MKKFAYIAAPVLLALPILFLAACGGTSRKVALDPDSAKFYDAARLIMTGQENAIFNHLPDADSRKEFIKDFWDKRDPDPDTAENEFKTEYESRVEYAKKHFRESGLGSNSDRGRIYIFMGRPDKIDESFSHGDPTVRGSIIWWVYYNYQLGIEFVDESGTGPFRIRRYDGDFFEALDALKLGQYARDGSAFKKTFVDFGLRYDPSKKEFIVSLPIGSLNISDDQGVPRVDLDFIIFVYLQEGGGKEKIEEPRTFRTTDNELIAMKEIVFTFPRALPRGSHFVDVIIEGGQGAAGKIRKIFEVKVK
jgi:GWxTD domain-containing protein